MCADLRAFTIEARHPSEASVFTGLSFGDCVKTDRARSAHHQHALRAHAIVFPIAKQHERGPGR
eukprot:12811559-Alexandrium_andersonii.AAC.1